MNRETLIIQLMHKWHVRTEKELMNELQEHGRISDNAVNVGEVCDGDLIRALDRSADDRAYSALMKGETHL